MADFITVTATIERADAEPRVRFVIFTPTAIVFDSVGNVIYTTEPIKVPVQSDGSLGITGDGVDLLAINSEGISPPNFQYKVRLDYTHPLRDPREWFIEIDKDEPGGTVDLADLAPASFVDASHTYVLRTEYHQLLDDMGETILPDTTGVPDGQVLMVNDEEPLGTEWSSDIMHLAGEETATGAKRFASTVDVDGRARFAAGLWVDVTHPLYGAVGDDTTDDQAAIQAAIDAAGSYGTVFFPPGLTYRIASALFQPYEGQVWMLNGATISVDLNGVGVTVGQTGVRTRECTLVGGRVIRKGGPDFTSGNVGVRWLNVSYGQWRGFTIIGFEKGLQCYADSGEGTSYCDFYPLRITSNKFGWECRADGAGSFVNENKMFGGRIGYASNDPDATNGYNVRWSSINGGNAPNNNKLFGTALEGATVTAGSPTGAIYDNGNYNDAISCRYEGNGWTAGTAFITQGPDITQGGNVYAFGRGLSGPKNVTIAGSGARCTIIGEHGRYFGGSDGTDALLTLGQTSSNSNVALVQKKVDGTDGDIKWNGLGRWLSSLIPNADAAVGLGGSTRRWTDLFLSGLVTIGSYAELSEIAGPSAPAADKARLYVRDNGAGKTQLVVRFPTGAVQVIATEP